MDFTVGFVSRNLVTKKIFFEIVENFQFSGHCVSGGPKNGIFEKKNLESGK